MEAGISNAGFELEPEGEKPKPSLSVDRVPSKESQDSNSQIRNGVNSENVTIRREDIEFEDLESEDVEGEPNIACLFIGNLLEKFWVFLDDFTSRRKNLVRLIVLVSLSLLYNSYFVACIHYSIRNGIPINWCDNVGLLIILTIITYVGLFYFQVVKRYWGSTINQVVLKPLGTQFDHLWKYW